MQKHFSDGRHNAPGQKGSSSKESNKKENDPNLGIFFIKCPTIKTNKKILQSSQEEGNVPTKEQESE